MWLWWVCFFCRRLFLGCFEFLTLEKSLHAPVGIFPFFYHVPVPGCFTVGVPASDN